MTDMSRRQKPRWIRTASESLLRKINKIREWIFAKGGLVNGTGVENALGPESLVPTRVGCFITTIFYYLLNPFLECLLQAFTTWARFLFNVRTRLFARV
jgi:hypothetical protein